MAQSRGPLVNFCLVPCDFPTNFFEVYFYSCTNSFIGKLNTEHLSHHVNVLNLLCRPSTYTSHLYKISYIATCHLSAPIYKIRMPCATKLFLDRAYPSVNRALFHKKTLVFVFDLVSQSVSSHLSWIPLSLIVRAILNDA